MDSEPVSGAETVGGSVNFIRYGFCLTAFLCVICLNVAAGSQNDLCGQATDTLNCAKNNFDTLYSKNYSRFWQILHDADSKAKKCDSIEDTISFLDLAQIKSNNAEFNEYFSEVIERLTIAKTECFLLALTRMGTHPKVAIIEKLHHPLFIDSVTIERAFNNYKNNKDYKNILDLYFGTQK